MRMYVIALIGTSNHSAGLVSQTVCAGVLGEFWGSVTDTPPKLATEPDFEPPLKRRTLHSKPSFIEFVTGCMF